ncbi:MAG: hypothetical protein ACJ752_06195 [Gaiellaceae bacterium]
MEGWCAGWLTGLVAALPLVACLEPPLAVAVAPAAGVECACAPDRWWACLDVERGGTTTFATGPGPEPECEPGPEPSPSVGR